MTRFSFTPRFCQSHSQPDLPELLQEKEEKEEKEAQEKEEKEEKEVQQKEEAGSQARRILGQLCREHPGCCRTPPCSSCWNCDGEILPHAAIQVRYTLPPPPLPPPPPSPHIDI